MSKLKKIAPASVALHVGISMAAVGLAVGILSALFGGMFGGAMGMGAMGGGGMALGAVIFVPIYMGVTGALFSAIWAWVYNLVAERFGGIEVTFE